MTQRNWLFEIADDKNSEQDYHDFNVLTNTENLNRIITCYLHNDFHIFTDNSLKEVQEILLADTFDLVKEIYIPGLFKWLEENNSELMDEIIEREDRLNEFILTENNYNEYQNLLEGYKSLYVKAIGSFKPKSYTGGLEMALIAKAPRRQLCPEGVHNATLADTELRHHEEWGERILLTFHLDGKTHDDGTDMKVFEECSFILTPKAKLRKIVEALLNKKLSKEQAEDGVDLESMIGLKCQLVVVHKEGKDGNIYPRVETVLTAK